MVPIKEQIIALWRNKFEEVLEEKRSCPVCKNRTVIRHIVKEPQQKFNKKWFVEWCNKENCPHWTCGFLPKRYKPQCELKWVNEKILKSSKDNRNE